MNAFKIKIKVTYDEYHLQPDGSKKVEYVFGSIKEAMDNVRSFSPTGKVFVQIFNHTNSTEQPHLNCYYSAAARDKYFSRIAKITNYFD
jgi:hypothetical protein